METKFKAMIKRLILIPILVFVAGNALIAQTNWDLDQCISFALKNNIELKKMEVEEKLASEDFSQSKRNLLPGISASSNAGFNFGRSIDPITNGVVNTQFFNSSFSVGSSITLFSGFRMINQIEYQKFRKKAAEMNRVNAVDDLAFKVMNSYFDVLYYKGLLEIATKQVEASGLNMKKVERQVELGIKSKTDLFEMKANYEGEELKRIQAENYLKSATLQLKQYMNLTDTTEMLLAEEQSPVAATAVPDRQSLFNSYLEWSPYYQSYQSLLKANRKQLDISRSSLYPTITANGSLGSAFSETNKDANKKTIDFNSQIDNNFSQYLGASLSIPIFGKWGYRSNIAKAKLEVQQAQNTLDEQKQKLYFEMQSNLNDLEAIEKEYNQYLKQLEADKLAFQAAEKKIEQGLVSVFDFYITKNRYANSENQVLQSRLQLEVKRKALDFYSGKRFWEQ
jgi:outer membrane protein